MKIKEKATLFCDPDFRILHYWDAEESLFIGINRNSFKNLTMTQLIDSKVRPTLKSILHKEFNGYFDPTYSFDMNERYVLFNFESEVMVCNLECAGA